MSTGLPFTYEQFHDPELAVEELGFDEAMWRYEQYVEPRYAQDALDGGLPKDWMWRKFYVYHRDEGRCQNCGRKNPYIWDVHHLQHRGNGGDHSLQNLILLCRRCHLDEHPDR